MAKNFHVTIRMDERFWEDVKAKAQSEGTNASAIVHTLLEAWLGGCTDVQTQTDSDTSVPSIQPSVRDELESLKQQIQALTEAMGNSSAGDRPQHPHHPESYGDPTNFAGQNPNRLRIRDKLPA